MSQQAIAFERLHDRRMQPSRISCSQRRMWDSIPGLGSAGMCTDSLSQFNGSIGAAVFFNNLRGLGSIHSAQTCMDRVCRDTILGLRLTCWMGLVESSSSKFVIYIYIYQIISHLRNVQGKTHRGTGKNSARPWTLDDRQACKQVTVPIKHRIWTQTGKDPNKRSIISFPLRGHLQRFGIPQSRPTYSDLQELRLWRFGEWLGWHHGYLGSTWWCWDFHGSRSEHRCRGEPLHQF